MKKIETDNESNGRDIGQGEYSIDKQPIRSDTSSERVFFCRKLVPIILLTFAVKCFLAWCFPFTGDEAYFVLLGKNIAMG